MVDLPNIPKELEQSTNEALNVVTGFLLGLLIGLLYSDYGKV